MKQLQPGARGWMSRLPLPEARIAQHGNGICRNWVSRQHHGTIKGLDSLLTFEIHERGDGKGRRRASKDQRIKLTKLSLL